MGDFDNFNVIGRGKYAELHEYAKNENPGPQLTLNSNSVGNFYSKITKVFPEAVHGYFLFKIGILWFRGIRNCSLL